MNIERLKNKQNDLTVVNAARVSFGKQQDKIDPERDGRLIRYLAKNGHWTPFGHVRHAFAFNFQSDKALTEWLMRRRAGWEIRRGKIDRWYIVEGSLFNWLGTPDDLPPVSPEDYQSIVAYLKNIAGCSLSVEAFGLEVPDEGNREYSLYVVPTEHETYRISAPIFVLRQLMRSNVGIVYNETSRRYVDDPPTFFDPGADGWRARPEKGIKQGSSDRSVRMFSRDQMNSWLTGEGGNWPWAVDIPSTYSEAVENARLLYEEMLKAGVAPELARMVLPQSMNSEIWMTASPEAVRRIISLRNNRGESNHAQKEIETLARQMETLSNVWRDQRSGESVPES